MVLGNGKPFTAPGVCSGEDHQDEEVVSIHHLCSPMLSTSMSIKHSFLIYSFVSQRNCAWVTAEVKTLEVACEWL